MPGRRPHGFADFDLLLKVTRECLGGVDLPAAAWPPHSTHETLTQELFVTLLSKDRFRYYLDAGLTDREIETEVVQIELTNLLTPRLRKRYPESYRLARRISALLQTSRRPDAKPMRAAGEMEAMAGREIDPDLTRDFQKLIGV